VGIRLTSYTPGRPVPLTVGARISPTICNEQLC